MQYKHLFLLVLILSMVHLVSGQTPDAAHNHGKRARKPAVPSIETQLRQMREELQGQIDDLKTRLAVRDAQIEAMQTGTQSIQEKTAATTANVQTLGNAVHENTAQVNEVQTKVATLQTESSSVSTSVQQVTAAQATLQKKVDEPASIHYKGITIVPGGFLAGESIWRQRAMNADIYTNFNATPYMNSGEAHTSEWVPTARQSRLSSLFTAKVPFGTVSGYFEGDFLSAGDLEQPAEQQLHPPRTTSMGPGLGRPPQIHRRSDVDLDDGEQEVNRPGPGSGADLLR